jgi:putative membrane protein
MNFNPMRIMMLGMTAMLCPAALLGQAGAVYVSSMGQANQPGQGQPVPSNQPQPGMGQQTAMPSMQESVGSSGTRTDEMKDKMFLRQAAEGGIAEVQFGQLAAQKGGSDEVKTFGQKMVEDHGALNKEIEDVADSAGVMLPKRMNKESQAEYDKLNGLSGDAFDTEYLTLMVKAHHKDLRDFRMESASTQNQALREMVVKGQRVIYGHMVMVDKLARSKGVEVPGHHHYKPASPSPE